MLNKNKKSGRLIRPNQDRANTIVVVFIVMIVVSVMSSINSLMFYNKYANAPYNELLEVQQSGHLPLIMLFGGLSFILLIVAIVNFLNWFRRAYYNLHTFSKYKLSYDEDMAVWSFMIPFINLVRPFSIATEIYDITHAKAQELTNEEIPKNDTIISIWWMAFIVLGILISLLSQIGGEDNLQEIIQSMFYFGIAEILEIPRLVAAIFMIKAVSKVETIVYQNRMKIDDDEVLSESTSEE